MLEAMKERIREQDTIPMSSPKRTKEEAMKIHLVWTYFNSALDKMTQMTEILLRNTYGQYAFLQGGQRVTDEWHFQFTLMLGEKAKGIVTIYISDDAKIKVRTCQQLKVWIPEVKNYIRVLADCMADAELPEVC